MDDGGGSNVATLSEPLVAPQQGIAFDPLLLASFLIPFTSLIQFQIVGTVFGQDVVGLVLLAVLGWNQHHLRRLRHIRLALVLLLLWLAGQIATDLYRVTPFADYSRGWAKIIFFAVQLCGLWMLISQRASYLAAMALGFGLASALRILQLEPPYSLVPWKFGLGAGLAYVLAALSCGALAISSRLRPMAPFALLGAGLICLSQDARSLFAICLLAAAATWLVDLLRKLPNLRRRLSPPVFVLLLLCGAVLAQGLGNLYGYFAGRGDLGAGAQQKYILQTSGDVGLLRGGRAESLVSTIAIADSPILGHGSWARDIHYARLLQDRMKEVGLTKVRAPLQSDLIPTHSHLLGAWVEAGILGGVFWLDCLGATMAAAFSIVRRPPVMAPLLLLILVDLTWSIMFSPFGAQMRFAVALQLSAIFAILRRQSMQLLKNQ